MIEIVKMFLVAVQLVVCGVMWKVSEMNYCYPRALTEPPCDDEILQHIIAD